LNVNVSDWTGARFNNLAVAPSLRAAGIEPRFLVWKQSSGETEVGRLLRLPGSRKWARLISAVERRLSLHAVLHAQSFLLPLHSAFRRADVVHYHIIYDDYFSLLALPFLTRLKPSVWTFHDPWPMTGHCIYPLACEKWTSGCGACPQLDLPFPMRRDRTRRQFMLKQWLYARSRIDVVVASRYMMDMTERSPIASAMHRHLVPFGVDLEKFKPRPKLEAQRRLGVLSGRTVVGVRAADGPYKGFKDFTQALELLGDRAPPLCIVSTHGKGELNQFIGRHQIIELGWVDDESVLLDSYAAADFFVMPSRGEAFGLMAVEAMASGVPVIVTSGTSLPEVVDAPRVGVCVPNGDPVSLANAIIQLAADVGDRRRRGERSRILAEARYDARAFSVRLKEVYQTALDRRDRRGVA